MPNALDIAPEDIVAEGRERGKSPQEIAAKIRLWRDDALNQGAQAWADKDPEHYAAGVSKLDAHAGEVLGSLRSEAEQDWARQTFQTPEELETFSHAWRGGPEMSGAFDEQKRQLAELRSDTTWTLPPQKQEWETLNDAAGSKLGRMQIIDRGAEQDVLLNYLSRPSDDPLTTPNEYKTTRIVVPKVKDQEIEGEAAAAEARAKAARDEVLSWERVMNATNDPEAQQQMGAQKALAMESLQKELQRAGTLRDPAAGRDLLMQERTLEKLRESPAWAEVSKRNLGEDFLRGAQKAMLNLKVAINDATGDTAERDQARYDLAHLRDALPGSTGRWREGVRGFVSDAAEGAGGMTPQIAAMAAGPAGAGAVRAAGALSMTQMGGSAYGAGIDETLGRAEQMEAQAQQLAATDEAGAQQLRDQAQELRADYRGIAGVKAGVEMASEMILPEHKLLTGGATSALKRVGEAAGKSMLEGAAAEIGSQAVNAAVFGDAIDLTQIARGAALEAAAGAPMIAASALPRRASDGVLTPAATAPSLPDSEPLQPQTIGGRAPLIPATPEEQAQIDTMRPGFTEAALANAPRSLLEIATGAATTPPAASSPTTTPPATEPAPAAAATIAPDGGTDDAPMSGIETANETPVLNDTGEGNATPNASLGDTISPVAGDIVTYEGYTGRLQRDGERLVIDTADGRVVDVADAAAVQRVTDPQVTQRVRMAEIRQLGNETPAVQETRFQGAVTPQGQPAIVDAQGRVFVPQNDQLLRTVRQGPNGVEVLVRNQADPGRVIKLTGKQAMQAQDALLSAAEQIEAKGGKVNWGTARAPRLHFSRTPGMAPSLDRARVSQTQEPAQQQLPRIQLSATTAKVKTATRKAVLDALRLLKDRLPGLQNERVLAFANAGEFLASGYAGAASFTAEEIDGMQDAEGFFDTQTGHTIVFTDQITLRDGETPIRAVARVLLHERVGHEGLNTLIAQDASHAARWNKIASVIPAAELDAIAAEAGYTHLAGDRAQLALEWLARKVESVEGARNAIDIERSLSGIARQLWQALKEMLAAMFKNFSREAALAHEVHEIIGLAREAAINGTSTPTNADALAHRVQFSRVRHTAGTPFEVRNLVVRAVLTGSPLSTSYKDTVAETNAQKQALDHEAARIGSMIEQSVKLVQKRLGTPLADLYKLVNDVFDGVPQSQAVLQTVDETLAEAARRGRNLIDEMSENIGLYLPAGTMRTTIMQNLGGYMRRGYAVFDATANWNYKSLRAAAEKGVLHNGQDARALMAAATAHIVSQQPALAGQVGLHGLPRPDTRLSGILVDLLDRDTQMNALVPGRASSVRSDVTSLIRRKEIAAPIRALMGEHTNPMLRYAATASFQTQFLAKFQAQARMRQIGLATGLLSTTQTDTYHYAIPETDAWGPLQGLFTTRELLAAMQQTQVVGSAGSDMPSLIGRAYKAILVNAKMNLVALNPKSTAVNFIGGAISSVASGDILAPALVSRFTRALKISGRSGKPTKADLQDATTLALRDMEAQERAFLIGAGILNNDLTLAEIEANTPEAILALFGDANARIANAAVGTLHGMAIGNALGRVAGPVGQRIGIAAGGAAGALVGGKRIQWAHKKLADYLLAKPDGIWKVAGFYSQRRTYLEGLGLPPGTQATQQQMQDADRWAAERVRNTYPDYAKVHPLIRHLSLIPLLGNFVSFAHELVRNLAWNVRYAKNDLHSGNPALRRDAMRRIAGGSAAYLFSTPLLNTAGTLLFGWLDDDDEREEIFSKWLAPSYDKNASLTFKSINGEGVTYFRQGYLIPQAVFGDMIRAAASSALEGEFGDALLKPTAMVMQQLGIGENLFNVFVESLSGEDKYGRKIYANHEDAATKVIKGVDHASKTLTDPGYAKMIQEVVRAYAAENQDELGRLGNNLLGIRERRVTWEKALLTPYYNFRDQIQAVRDNARQQLDPRNRHLLTDSVKIVENANVQLRQIASEIERFERDMSRLPIPPNALSKARKESRIGREIKPFEPSK